ncbi:MAG: VapE domain-containing protein, partial [Saprospiraceae bacterium]
ANQSKGNDKEEYISKYRRLEIYLNERYDFRYNDLSKEVEYKPKGSKAFDILNENDLIREVLLHGFKGVKTYLELLMGSSFVEKYDPIINYCKELEPWTESEGDHITNLANYVKAKDQHWFNSQFKKMLVRTLACGLGYIPFNKQCFSLYGSQNDGKSSFIRFLCPPALQDFYSEDIDFQSKDGLIALASNFIINLDELDSLQRKEITSVKKFMSTSKIKARPPFGKRAVPMVRRVSFLATTNEGEFLTDTTGNVRWLVMEIKGIQHDNGKKNGYNKNIDINRVWAQAYGLLKSGFDFKMTVEEIQQSEMNNRGHQVKTREMELLQQYCSVSKINEGVFMTTTNITEYLQSKTAIKINHYKVGPALRFLNFKPKSGRINGSVRKGYYVTKND